MLYFVSGCEFWWYLMRTDRTSFAPPFSRLLYLSHSTWIFKICFTILFFCGFIQYRLLHVSWSSCINFKFLAQEKWPMLVGNDIVHMTQGKSRKLREKETFLILKNWWNPRKQMIGPWKGIQRRQKQLVSSSYIREVFLLSVLIHVLQ